MFVFIGQLSLLSPQLRELCTENASLKGRIAALEETVNVHEMEAKASRETILRLVSEVSREQRRAASRAEENGQLQRVGVRGVCARGVCVRIWGHVYEQKLEPRPR